MVQLEPHHAQLLLQIYDMRREPMLRKARAWLLPNFTANTLKEFSELCPTGSDQNAYYRQVVSYWDMVAAIVNKGMLDADLFFETTSEELLTWLRVKNVVQQMREARKNPLYLKNLEMLAEKHEQWIATRAPSAMQETHKMIANMNAAAAAKR